MLQKLLRFAAHARAAVVAYAAGLDRRERAVLVVVALLHGAALSWGLPSSDGWDNDGVAPRDFLPGLIQTFTPGQHYTYPPLHLAVLALLTLPVTIFAALRAPSLAQADIVAAFLDVRVMTAFTVTARVVSFLCAIGIVIALGELAASVARGHARSKGTVASDTVSVARAAGMAVAGVDVSLTYYAQTTNLDVPYLFWASLALLVFARSVEDDRARGLRLSATFAACAIATKDQAYALFLLSLPVVAIGWALSRPRGNRHEVLKEGVVASGIGLGLLLLFDGAFFNPTGFLARVRFLLGPASQDFAQYSKDLGGRLAAFSDSWTPFGQHYPWVFAPLFVTGLVIALCGDRPRARVLALLPLLAALSFTITFNCLARRVEERFVMPQMLFVGVYGAVAIDWLFSVRARAPRLVAMAVIAASFAIALRMSASVDAVMMNDPRYAAETFLEQNARPGDVIEVYGRNVYLPRFRPWMKVVRVGTEPTNRRNPMPGVEEKQDAYGAIAVRNPRFIVVGSGFVWRYLISEWSGNDGRMQPSVHRSGLADQDGRDHFHRLFEGKSSYREALHTRYESKWFPIVQIHGSLGAEVWVFERP